MRPRHPRVEKHAVERIHRVLGDLQPIAGIVNGVGNEVVIGQLEGIQYGEVGLVLGRPEIGEDQAFVFKCRVSAVTESVPNRTVLGLARCLEDAAVNVVEPAVVAAADTTLGENAVFERSAPMTAVLV